MPSGPRSGKALAAAYWKALKKGKNAKEAYDDVFGREDMRELEKQWKKYVEGL